MIEISGPDVPGIDEILTAEALAFLADLQGTFGSRRDALLQARRDRQAAIDPSRYEPHPKRRIDEPELLLGNAVVGVREVIRAVLTRAVAEARRVAGGTSNTKSPAAVAPGATASFGVSNGAVAWPSASKRSASAPKSSG